MNDPSEIRPAINPIFVPLKISDDEIEFRVGPFEGPKHTIKDSDREGTIGDLLEYFDGSHTVPEILAAFDPDQAEDVRTVIFAMLEKNALVDASERDPDALWSYSTLSERISEDERERLRTTTVGVVTRGRVGTMVASDLAESGVESVRVHDLGGDQGDRIESDPGLDSHDGSVEDLVSAVEYVLYADRSPGMAVARELNEHAVATGTPVTFGQVLGAEAVVGPTVLPERTPCLECLLERWKMHLPADTNYPAYAERAGDPGEVHLPAHSRLAAGLLAKEATTQLLTGHGYVVGRTVDVELLGMEFEANEVLRIPRCEVCGTTHDDWQRLIDPEVLRDRGEKR